jgi:hypothetical protein
LTDQDVVDRLLIRALGPSWTGRDPDDVVSLTELDDLLRDVPRGEIEPLPEDHARVLPIPRNASAAEAAHAYQRAQANALLRLARAEKARRLAGR